MGLILRASQPPQSGGAEDPLPSDAVFGSPGRNGYIVPFSYDTLTQNVDGWSNAAIWQGDATVGQLILTGALSAGANFYLDGFHNVDYGSIFASGGVYLSLNQTQPPPAMGSEFVGINIQNATDTSSFSISNVSNLIALTLTENYTTISIGGGIFVAPAVWNVGTSSAAQTNTWLATFYDRLNGGNYEGSSITISGDFPPPNNTVTNINVSPAGVGLPDGDLVFHFEGGSGSGGGGTFQVSGGTIIGTALVDGGNWTSPPTVVIDDPQGGAEYAFTTTLGNRAKLALQNAGVAVSTP